MKRLFFVFAILQVTVLVYAQEEILPIDESGNYTFYEVVELNDFNKETLLNNAEAFLKHYINKKYKKDIQKDPEAGQVTARSSFLVYKKGSFGKHVDGAIEYSISIEAKDNRYRYVITGFIFQEYQRDRYGKFQPVKGKVKNLEEPVSDINKWQWDDHKKTVKTKMEALTSELKLNMLRKHEKSDKKIKVKEEW